MDSFSTVIPCDLKELAGLREQLDDWLVAQAFSPQAAFDVKLATHEAARNAIDHAEPCDYVKVRADLDDDAVVVEVLDTNNEPWELEAANDQELHGVTLIQALTRQVEMVHSAQGTALLMLLVRS